MAFLLDLSHLFISFLISVVIQGTFFDLIFFDEWAHAYLVLPRTISSKSRT